MIELNPKYKPLFSSESRYYVVSGGRGSSKSYSVSVFALLLTFEKDQNVLFTRYTMTSAHSSIIPEFVEKIEMLGLVGQFTINKTEITNNVTGNRILFKGIKTGSGNQTAALKSISGITCFIMDEAEEMPDEATFSKIDLSIRSKVAQNRVIVVLNPTTKEHWIYSRFFQEAGVMEGTNQTRNNVTYIHTTYIDNKEHLGQSFLDQMERMRTMYPDKYKHTILGGWRDKAEGVIFTNWKIGEYKSQGLDVFGADWGFSVDPSVLIKISIDQKNKIIYCDERLYKAGLNTSQLREIFMRECGRNLIVADGAEPRLIAELRGDVNIKPAIKGAGSINFGISLIQNYTLVVTPSSVNLIKELNNYAWSDKKSETPIDNFNHLLDALRYIVGNQIGSKYKGRYFIG